MNPLSQVKAKNNPGFEGTEDHGDLWTAIRKNYLRIEKVDDRVRSAVIFCVLPIGGFIVALQLTLLGLIVGHMVLA